MRLRNPAAVALTAIVSLAPILALPAAASNSTGTAAAVTDAAAVAPKVVIVVGATEATTPSYRSDADSIAAEALKYTPNVVKLYSPNATWAQVKTAAQGASIFVYLGHGYGFPSPYRPVLSPGVQDGMGLNEIGGVDDWDKKYYGESKIASEIRFAKDAIVLLNHLCYSAGSSEDGDPEPTISVARQRVDNYASGFIRAGARTVIAQSWTSGVIYAIRAIFTTDQTLLDVWRNAPNRQGHEQPFVPVRNPQFEGSVDPDTWTTGFHRSIVSAASHRTTDVVAGAGAGLASGSTPAVGAGPELWSMDGATDLTPNFDGVADTLALLGRFSESVSWTARIRDAANAVVRSQSGSGHQASITWDAKVGGEPAQDGDYTWNVQAADVDGNTVEASGPITLTHPEVPPSGVLTFKPTTPTMTTGGTISYALVFAGPVTGLSVSDFTRTGSATKCVVNAPVGSGATYTVDISGCATGTVGFYLNAGQVLDASLAAGPSGPVSAPTVTIDATKPTATAPRPNLKTNVGLGSASKTAALKVTLTWTGKDTGAGVASYDVRRSVDGGSWTTIASKTTSAALDVTLTPGHGYRFKVRARDKAGNIGAWAATSTWYPKLVQQGSSAVVGNGGWSGGSNSSFSGGTAKSSTTPGASLSYAFNGRAVALVTTLRSDAGEVQVWVDGVLAATIDTAASSTTYRQVTFNRSWTAYGSHTIKVVVVGTAGRPRVEVDAFELIR